MRKVFFFFSPFFLVALLHWLGITSWPPLQYNIEQNNRIPRYFCFILYLRCRKASLQRSQWHPSPVLLLGKSHGWRSLVGCSPWVCLESDTTERLHFSLSCIGEGNGNPLQCSCLENPRNGGAWWAAVYGVAQSQTRLMNSTCHISGAQYQCWMNPPKFLWKLSLEE